MGAIPWTWSRPGAVGSSQHDRAHRLSAGDAVLIVDDEPGMRSFLRRGLSRQFQLVETAADVEEAQALLNRCHFDLLIADIRLPGQSGLDWVRGLREQHGNLDVIFITANADLESAIGALRAGAADFILKPFRLEQLLSAALRCTERRSLVRENFLLQREAVQRNRIDGLVGHCDPIKEVCSIIERIAPMRSTVLITGESGTGKELAARALHARSGRPGSFVPINCGAVSGELLESELFGHVKGAFTGAHQSREGLFSFAHGGSLFLDEIGELPLGMQAKLLRVLEEKTIRPVGGNQETPVDVRIIAATNRDLASEVQAGRFREDLFYRLNVVSVRLPALRERVDDMPDLIDFFLDHFSAELGLPRPQLGVDELALLSRYDWPGNIRELRNVIERSLLLGRPPSRCIAQDLPASEPASDPAPDDASLAAIEQCHILRVLDSCQGNKSAAARQLGISRKTLERKLKRWDDGDDPDADGSD
ncbi:sigma-54 dependent transcriptional regulator [uncultured Thiohalocapsa sp.]|uniref:sigma-54-dependent transcriptional regulator n=1 Tax=uncultured Thiohalocapsa sp. TaxID=768990 RepID=UPI0025D1409C|nr:sigma-54 dependent transcriptional regulator [uncultured Thiohalocapsa sp.]